MYLEGREREELKLGLPSVDSPSKHGQQLQLSQGKARSLELSFWVSHGTHWVICCLVGGIGRKLCWKWRGWGLKWCSDMDYIVIFQPGIQIVLPL